jgi:hypothetical protein
MSYVTLTEAAGFGATSDVTQPLLEQAAAIVNSHCGKPKGMLIEANNGEPVCMAYATPTFTYQSSTPISSGTSVTVKLPTWMPVTLGDVLVIDRGLTTSENVAVTAINADGSVVFDVVEFNHSTPIYYAGLTIVEEKRVSAKGRYSLRLTPIVNFVSLCSGSLGIQQPRWTDSSRLDLSYLAGDTVKACYLAGYTTTPDAIKLATVLIANQLAEASLQGAGYYKSEEYAGRSYERFSGVGYVDPRIAEILNPYRCIV